MDNASGWAFLDALMTRLGIRGIPHFVTTSLTLGVFDQEQDALFRFADQNSKFLWAASLYTSDNAAVMAGTDTISGGALVQLNNVGNSGSFDNGDLMPVGAIFGRDAVGGGPKALPVPFVVNGLSTMKMKVKNKVAGAHTMLFTLIGIREL